MLWISESRPAPRAVGHAKRTVNRGPWTVGRFNRAGVGERTRNELRAVVRVLGPFWAVSNYAATYCLKYRQSRRS